MNSEYNLGSQRNRFTSQKVSQEEINTKQKLMKEKTNVQ